MERTKGKCLGIQDLKKDVVVSSLGFLFWPIYLRLGAGKTGNPMPTQMCEDKNNQNKSLHCSQRTRKEAPPQDRNLLKNNYSTITRHYRKILWLYPDSEQQKPIV